MKIRKKSVVIDAMRFSSDADVSEISRWSRGAVKPHAGDPAPGRPSFLVVHNGEGRAYDVHATLGDWIIRSVEGEFYPCSPSVFEATYEPVPEAAPIESGRPLVPIRACRHETLDLDNGIRCPDCRHTTVSIIGYLRQRLDHALARNDRLETAFAGIPDDVLDSDGIRKLIVAAQAIFGDGRRAPSIGLTGTGNTNSLDDILLVYPVLRRLNGLCGFCGLDSHGGKYHPDGLCDECHDLYGGHSGGAR